MDGSLSRTGPRRRSNLAPWQRKLAYGIGVRLKRGSDPTIKQAVQGKKILDSAAAVGYVPELAAADLNSPSTALRFSRGRRA